MSRRHFIKIALPKLKITNHHYDRLDDRLKNVPDKAKVTITQPENGKITYVVITTKGKPPGGLTDTLVCGEPGTKANSSSALSFEMPHIRSTLLFEAYYPIKGSVDSRLTFHWDKE